jgi:hypothetical protein
MRESWGEFREEIIVMALLIIAIDVRCVGDDIEVDLDWIWLLSWQGFSIQFIQLSESSCGFGLRCSHVVRHSLAAAER